VVAAAIRQQKEIKDNQISKEEVQLSLFSDDMMLCIENPKESTKKLLELINELSKVTGYEINILKSVAFLYINNEAAETEIKESVPFTTAPKTRRYLGINLTKEVEDLYSENHKALTKETEDDTKKWKNILSFIFN